jgi:uncharacterized membrane protein
MQGGFMEAITIVGLVLLLVGCYYSMVDLLHDIGIRIRVPHRLLSAIRQRCCQSAAGHMKNRKIAGIQI